MTASRSSGRAVSRVTRTPRSVSPRASSPALVSRVSPTVSSVPMLRSSRGQQVSRLDGRHRPQGTVRRNRQRRAALVSSIRPSARSRRPFQPECHPGRSVDPTARRIGCRASARPRTSWPAARNARRGHGPWPGPRRPGKGRDLRDCRARSAGSPPSSPSRSQCSSWPALLATLGTALFLGEWLLGSLGWGVLHGVLFLRRDRRGSACSEPSASREAGSDARSWPRSSSPS